MHYTPNGKEVVDRSKLGIRLAKAPASKRYLTFAISAPSDANSFAIPPGASNRKGPQEPEEKHGGRNWHETDPSRPEAEIFGVLQAALLTEALHLEVARKALLDCGQDVFR